MKASVHSAAPDTSQLRTVFAADVEYYLAQDPRQLPSRYLYDALGSALFEAICRLPWYPVARAEHRLLVAHASEILDVGISTIVELGAGSGDKLAALLANSGSHHRGLNVHLVDVSRSALRQASRTLERFRHVGITSHEGTYEVGLEQFAAARSRVGHSLLLFLGSNIGNFDPPAREAFMGAVRTALRPGDTLLLGVDLIKPEAQLLLAYDDPLEVTAAFNRNLLVRINRELQGNFDLDGFAHRAVWNPSQSRIEMHLVSRRIQRIKVVAAGLDFVMREGESIWTESSYKHDPAEIRSMLERSRFHVAAQWIDTVDGFALTRAECV